MESIWTGRGGERWFSDGLCRRIEHSVRKDLLWTGIRAVTVKREACQPAKQFMMVGALRAPEPAGP